MAGYLGTLFMANVGMRLLLPPRSEFNKAASNFGAMVGKVSTIQKRYFNRASGDNISSLRNTLMKSSQLAKSYSKENASSTVSNLSSTLRKINGITKQSISSVSRNFGITKNQAAGVQKYVQRMNLNPAALSGAKGGTFAKAYGNDLEKLARHMKEVQKEAIRMANVTAEGAAQLENMAGSMLGQFRQALTVSVSLLTTLGYSIRGLSQDFAVFEQELINANSIWQEQNEVLYSISDRVVKFGEDYGVAYDNASRVLYQFASAGLEAAEAQAVLNDVLILSMAVQGDANTIGKLTVQTIKGFGLEMSDAGEVTDKFAHSINASLIEYQDLASAIKFALPFYVATNQSLDQLLGSIQILTDRALEAGIAGRGLRQALAEFAEGAEDSTRKFAEMGVKVVDAQGNFLQMTEIARNFSNAIGTDIANDTELLTSLIDDLNIRGATAFIHLVQNVDEFEQAVAELANSQGAANEMAMIQQGALTMQVQLLRNAAKEVFFLAEEQHVANGYLNEFDYRLKSLVESFRTMFIVDMPDGSKELTQFAYDLRDTVIVTLEGFESLLKDAGYALVSMTQGGYGLADMARELFYPLQLVGSTLMLIDNVLGGVGGDGLILKFYTLRLMFGTIGSFAIMASQGIQSLLASLDALGDALGVIMMVASVFPMFSGARMAMFGARGTMMGRSLGTKGGSSRMWGARDVTKSREFREGLDDVKSPFVGKAMQTGTGKRGATYKEFLAEQPPWLTTNTLNTRGRGIGNPLYSKRGLRSQYENTYPIDTIHNTQAYYDKQRAVRSFTDSYVQSRGRSRLGAGMFMGYSGYMGSVGYDAGSNYAYAPMMAQMDTSSMSSGGGQDLYINNAYVESNNFKDLFYQADEYGG